MSKKKQVQQTPVTIKDLLLTLINSPHKDAAIVEKNLQNMLRRVLDLQFIPNEDPAYKGDIACGSCLQPHKVFEVNGQLVAFDTVQNRLRHIKKSFIAQYKFLD